MSTDNFHIDTELDSVLSALRITDYEITTDDEVIFPGDEDNLSDVALSFTVECDSPQFAEYLLTRLNYYDKLYDDADTDALLTRIVDELNTGLDVSFNRVSRSPPTGEYVSINPDQWEAVDADNRYDDYRDLLSDLTDVEDPESLSVPGLFDKAVNVIVESDKHTLPESPVVVENVLLAHIRDVKAEHRSRKAESELKKRLENNGVSARTAAHIASNMDDLLINDAEVEAQIGDDTTTRGSVDE